VFLDGCPRLFIVTTKHCFCSAIGTTSNFGVAFVRSSFQYPWHPQSTLLYHIIPQALLCIIYPGMWPADQRTRFPLEWLQTSECFISLRNIRFSSSLVAIPDILHSWEKRVLDISGAGRSRRPIMDEFKLVPMDLAAGFCYGNAMLARIVIIIISNLTSAFIPYDIPQRYVLNTQFNNISCDPISPLCKENGSHHI
jgi:hypothetical protein